MKIEITNVPQADELSKVIATVEAVYNDYKTDKTIAEYVGFTDRQGRYYRLAAIILGLLNNNNGIASLTDSGKGFIVLDEENRLKEIRSILKNNALFKTVIEGVRSSNDGLSRAEILNLLSSTIDGSESTIARRCYTVISWLLSSSIFIQDIRVIRQNETETIYKINEELEEEEEEEQEEKKEDISDSIYPATYPMEELDIKETHMQVISFLRKKEQGKIIVPEFQRNKVWKPQQKSRFIESLILNIPVPPFYISQDLEGGMIIVDGLQRSSAIFDYMDGKDTLVGLQALPRLNGCNYNDLSDDLKARIEDRELLLYILKPSVPMSIVFDIFNRINANGSQLTRQEIRNCIFIGKSTELLKRLAENPIFKDAIDRGIPSLRMKDREAILRFFAFSASSAPDKYDGNLDEFLGKTMRRINRMTQSEINSLEIRFLRVMRITFEFFKDKNFRLPIENSRGRINIALMEAITVFFDQKNESELLNNKDQIIQRYNELLNDTEFRDSIRISTGSEKNVKTRFSKVNQYLNNQL